MDKNYLKAQIQQYESFNEQEEIDKQVMLNFIDNFEDVVTRKNQLGHFTASAFVVNEDFSKSLLVHHNIFGGFIYPGGHADGEYDLLSVATREVSEETGLDVSPVSSEIFALQACPIKGHVKKGKYVAAHIHYDILFLLMAKNLDMDKIRISESENSQVKWVTLEDSYNEDAVDWIRPINQKIVEKIRKIRG
jgi:8-oxo-dGTP pyrophosphatase MutT (NUDIX family)